MSRILDISPELHAGVAVWPGDVGFARTVAMSIPGGDHLELSSITTTVHVGAHADAPNHYVGGGQGISERALEPYYGPCQVVRVQVARGARILPRDVTDAITEPRVLFRTGSFADPDRFDTDFNSLSPELIDWLADKGVVLVGIDTPSVDPFDSKALESHQALARHDLSVLEGIVLEEIPNGVYTLIALPLKIRHADASPVRAVLVASPEG